MGVPPEWPLMGRIESQQRMQQSRPRARITDHEDRPLDSFLGDGRQALAVDFEQRSCDDDLQDLGACLSATHFAIAPRRHSNMSAER